MYKTLSALIIVALLSGCALFDLNGDGEINPLTYLAEANIQIAWTDSNGAPYYIATDENGRLIGRFTSGSGRIYELTEGGGIAITDASGITIHITPMEEQDE